MTDRGHGNLTKPDLVDELTVFLTPFVEEVLARLEGEAFTTPQFIELLLTDETAADAYEEAVWKWGEREHASKMVIHGQVIPAILRRSPLVAWAGYAHGEPDEYAVPAWWTILPRTE